MGETVRSDAIGQLRECLARLQSTPTYRDIVQPGDVVFARFRPVFSTEHIAELTEDEFRSFLLFENNHHWTGLHRQGPRICADLPRLREALALLLDESRPVESRLDTVVGRITGMGKAIATAILLVGYPDKYGVWNRTSQAGMLQLGVWPSFDRGDSIGHQYGKINQILLQLRDALGTDLWTLDAIWWALNQDEFATSETPEGVVTQAPEAAQVRGPRFGLERHLHEFLRDNWNHLDLGRDWALHSEPGDEEAGYEYVCPIGRIDLLAKHRTEPKWLVIELKRNLSSDQVVGQVLRYMGWVQRHLAQPGEQVAGMVISHDADDSIRYALSAVANIELRLYEVEFRLKEPDSLD